MNANRVIQSRWSRLRAAYKAGLPALAVTRAREFLRDHPECGPAWKILGSALIDMGRHAEAEGALKRAIALCPLDKVWIPLAEMGHLHKARGEFWGAASWYGQAIKSVPDEASGHIGLGGILARFGRLQEAEEAHRAATCCTRGRRDEAYLNLALVLRAQQRYEEAAACLEQALKLDPKYAAAKKALRDVRETIRFLQKTSPEPASTMIGASRQGVRHSDGGAGTPVDP